MGDVYQDIKSERAAQDAKWGGSGHDDSHDADDWMNYIDHKSAQAGELIGAGSSGADVQLSRRMIQIAALAVACVESMDRQMAVERG